MIKRRSLLERLTGSIRLSDEDELLDDVDQEESYDDDVDERRLYPMSSSDDMDDEEDQDGELALDVIETPDAIIVKTMTAGVKKDDIEIGLTRDHLTVRGKRHSDKNLDNHDYHFRELYWGSFSRAIDLPAEIDIDAARASEEHGLLTITLPKIDRNRQAKVKIH